MLKQPQPNNRNGFDYDLAFSRNLGWLTDTEQLLLRKKRVAVIGLGGVGGHHCHELARLGVGALNIADFDQFELGNFNRQCGADMTTIGKNKARASKETLKRVNPELDLRVYEDGIHESNMAEFFTGVDVYIDGIDAYAIAIRRKVFAYCYANGIPAITAAPLGMGTAWLIFLPGKMSFDNYFGLSDDQPADIQKIQFLLGLAPKALHRHYVADASRFDFKAEKGVTTSMACYLASSVAVTETLKLLLGRGKITPAPHYQQFDTYLGKFSQGYLNGGMNNFWQRMKLKTIYMPIVRKMQLHTRPLEVETKETVISRVLEAARWSPSGDNTQPWRFEIISEYRFLLHFTVEGKLHADPFFRWNDGMASALMAGMMLESLRISASYENMALHISQMPAQNEKWVFDIALIPQEGLIPSELFPYLKSRYTNRKPYQLTPLSLAQKQALEASVEGVLTVKWFEGKEYRQRVARASQLCLTLRMQNQFCCDMLVKTLDFARSFSRDKIPVMNLNATALSRAVMKFACARADRLLKLSRIPFSTFLASVELEKIPNLNCAAHFLLSIAPKNTETSKEETYIKAGEAVQRFWLTAESLGLNLQPNYGLLIFLDAAQKNTSIAGSPKSSMQQALKIKQTMEEMLGDTVDTATFFGRIGVAKPNKLSPRSIRKPLEELVVS